ncbi:LOW QUALITY PROTEIN: Na(+)/citrate cotransporter [Procambarus clarkii]|uniref:LOW QUALITY PROTEIN: Na(+)/citrate cotransporter n=2 Tax=Procambarus clarkii TaxID=6728 RepID=UPI0037448ACF
MTMGEFWRRHVSPYWKSLVVLLVPILLLPFPLIYHTDAARCGYVIVIMAVYWMTEALPLAITALIPVFAFPLLGVISTGDICIVYMKETNMMFLGGLTVAIAVEHCNLHRRIALRVILLLGQSPRRLMAGFMLTTMFLSMWISNTATTAMMVPIVDAILVELYAGQSDEDETDKEFMDLSVYPPHQSQMELAPSVQKRDPSECKNGNLEQVSVKKVDMTSKDADNTGLTTLPPNESCRALRDMCFLATAYSANLGGTGSLTGTGPNLVIKGVLASSYSEPTGLNFLSWMLFNVPGMLICVVLAWLWLQLYFSGMLCGQRKKMIQNPSEERQKAVKQLILAKYRELGLITFQEVVVLTLFIILVLLWLFRAPEFIPGWAKWFEDAFGVEVDDATPAMFIVFLLFALPANLNFWCFSKPDEPKRVDNNSCLTWKVVQEKIPWGVVLLLGGGFAMAEGAKVSGLSQWMGESLKGLNGLHSVYIVMIVTFSTAMLTEVASNTATASILLPVLNELALNIQVNPIYLMLPATICCSYAFMLPVATPPNAIVFGAANMKTTQMMYAGIVMNIICIIVINVMINTLGVYMFDLNTMPSWTNSTTLL